MKSFKQKLAEVSKHNRSDENNRFKDMHDAETVKHPVAPDAVFTGEIKGKTMKKRPADDGTDAKYDSAYIKKTGSDAGGGRKLGEEAEQIDEISKGLAQRYYTKSYDAQRKAMNTMTDTEKARKPEKKKAYDDARKTFRKRGKGSDMAAKRLAYKGKNEEVELDESRAEAMLYHKKMSSYHDNMHKELKADGMDNEARRHAKARNLHFQAEKQHKDFHKDSKTATKRANDHTDAANQSSKGYERNGKKYDHMSSKRVHESVEQIDEISRSMKPMSKSFGKTVDPKKFDAYKKHMKKHSLDEPTVRMAHDNPDHGESKRMMKNPKYAKALDLYKNSMKEDVDLAENPMEEKPMMMNALRSMSHAMQGIAAYVSKTSDPEEWFQNKLAGVAKEMQTLYSYATAEVMSMGEELEETTMSATKKPVTMTGPDGKTRTVMRTTRVKRTDDHGMDKMSEVKKVKANELIKKALGAGIKENQSAALAKELDKATAPSKAGKKAVTLKKAPWEKNEAATIDESVKSGNFKFDNGKSTRISPQDAKLLNSMFKGLNTKNRKQMESVMKKDQAGFDEIVGFAREALQ